ncbi:MAG: response regulator [Desulfobacteraceae bacterium]|nr:response regulator [Desulfobacteraceae bacterium]
MSKGRILLIDDEQMILEVAQTLLETLGYEVTAQRDAFEALQTFAANPDEFDLVITDYFMPRLNGMDFTAKILHIRPRMPIIICTGFSEEITRETLSELGVGLLVKPFEMCQLHEAVEKMLRFALTPQLAMGSECGSAI